MTRTPITAVLFLLAGCGRDEEPVVEYSMSCENVECYDADESYYESSGDIDITCRWSCAEYQGEAKKDVRIEFVSEDGECFEVDSISVDEAFACWWPD